MTTYGSTVELVCVPPVYSPYPDIYPKSAVVCQEDGEWSDYRQLNTTCLPCNQSEDALDIANAHLLIHVTPGSFGNTGTVTCNADYVIFGNADAWCEADDGNIGWKVDTDAPVCVRNHWESPEPVSRN